jgi:hypothetical protein
MTESTPTSQAEVYELAAQLQAELKEELGDKHRVRIARNLIEVANLFLPTTEPPATLIASAAQDVAGLLQHSPDARAIVLEALFESSALLRRMRFSPHWGVVEDDYVPPQYDLELPPWMEEPELDEIAGPSDMMVTDAVETSTPNDWIVTTHHLARLSFDGFATKSDYYTHDDPGVHLLDRDWNDHVVRISTDRVVGVTTDVRCTVRDQVITKAIAIQITEVVLVPAGSPD